MSCTRRRIKRKLKTKKALLVGINYKGTSSELQGCINDIDVIREHLLKRGYKQSNIRVLTERPEDILPTKRNILNHLDWLVNNRNYGCDLFFHYSGHGSHIADRNNDENDGRDECLVPLDYNKNGMITDDRLKEFLKEINQYTKFFGVIDACHSSTMMDLKHTALISSHNEKRSQFRLDVNKSVNIKGDVFMISGCQDNQTSADAWINRKFQGALTHCFIEAVRQGDLTIYELMNKIYKVMKKGGFEQNPTFSSNKSINFEEKYGL